MFAFSHLLACFDFGSAHGSKAKADPHPCGYFICLLYVDQALAQKDSFVLSKAGQEGEALTMIEPVCCFIVPDGCGILSNRHSPRTKEQTRSIVQLLCGGWELCPLAYSSSQV